MKRVLLSFLGLSISFFASCNRPLDPSQQLRIEDMQLGAVSGGVQIPVTICVTNLSDRRTTLDQPLSDCGCLKATKGSVRLDAMESQQVEFVLQTPAFPQRINRKITFIDSDDRTREWTCAVTGEVIEQFWATPPNLSIEYEPLSPSISAELRIHRRDKTVPIAFVTENNKLDVVVNENSEATFVTVTIDTKQYAAGQDVLMVQNGDRETVLRVPVKWEQIPEVTFFPEWLTLNAEEQSQTIVVNFGPNISKDDVKITGNVPWIKVNDLTLGESGGVIEIQLDASKAAIPFEGRLFTLDAGVCGEFPYAAFIN